MPFVWLLGARGRRWQSVSNSAWLFREMRKVERNCAQWQADFWQVLDGELAEAESAALADHLHGCMACRTAASTAVAMHRDLLEVSGHSAQVAGTAASAPRTEPIPIRRSRRVIILDWRIVGAAAVVTLTLLGWSVAGLAVEGISQVRNALQGESFTR